jgi:hypothetical protein
VAAETLEALGRGGRPVNAEELFSRVVMDNFGEAPALSAPTLPHRQQIITSLVVISSCVKLGQMWSVNGNSKALADGCVRRRP